jgi:hypothetical protein
MFVDARSSQLAAGRDIDSATKTDINSLRYSQSGFRPDVAHSVLIYTPAGGEPAIKTYASEPVNENCFSLLSAAPPKAAAKQRCFSLSLLGRRSLFRRQPIHDDTAAAWGGSNLVHFQHASPSFPALCISIQSCAYSSGLVLSSPPCTLSSGNVLSCAPYFQSCTLIKSCNFRERPSRASLPIMPFLTIAVSEGLFGPSLPLW